MFDRLLLLKSGGKAVYFGEIGEEGARVANYFLDAAVDGKYYRPRPPEQVNVASWMLDVIGAGTSAKGLIAPYEQVYASSELCAENMAEVKRLATPAPGSDPPTFADRYAAPVWAQFEHVLRRLLTIYWRDQSYNNIRFFLMVFCGTMLGLVYQGVNDDDEPGINSKIAVVYMGVGLIGVLISSTALPETFKLRAAFYRERSSNTYAPWVYSTALGLVELPYLFVCTFLYSLPLYFIVGYKHDGQLFWQFVLVLYIFAFLFASVGQLMASWFPNIQVANIVQGLVFTFIFLFGGG